MWNILMKISLYFETLYITQALFWPKNYIKIQIALHDSLVNICMFYVPLTSGDPVNEWCPQCPVLDCPALPCSAQVQWARKQTPCPWEELKRICEHIRNERPWINSGLENKEHKKIIVNEWGSLELLSRLNVDAHGKSLKCYSCAYLYIYLGHV